MAEILRITMNSGQSFYVLEKDDIYNSIKVIDEDPEDFIFVDKNIEDIIRAKGYHENIVVNIDNISSIESILFSNVDKGTWELIDEFKNESGLKIYNGYPVI